MRSLRLKPNQEKFAKACFLSSAIFSVFAVFAILFYILYASLPAFREIGVFNFLFGSLWAPTKEFIAVTERFGILPMIVNSLAVTAGAIFAGGSVGIFTAVFLVFYCPKKLKGIFNQFINLLAGIPSIVYGFFGLTALVPMLNEISPDGNGKGVLACSLILGIMILPTVANLAKNALNAVPDSYGEGALALGSTKNQAVFKIVLPAAKSGVVSGLVLGIGRAIGETMAVMMIAGNAAMFPTGLFGNIRTLTTNIVIEMAYSTGLHREALIATGFVLLIFVLLLNVLLNLLKRNKKYKEKTLPFGRKKIAALNGAESVCRPVERSERFDAPDSDSSLSECGGSESVFGNNPYAAEVSAAIPRVSDADNAARNISRSDFHANGRIYNSNTNAFSDNTTLKFVRKGGATSALKYCSVSISAAVAASLAAIVFFILWKGLPAITWDLLFGASGNGHYTLLPAFVSTGMIIFLTLVIALPLGVAAAIYLVEFSKKGSKIVKVIRLFTDTLAGIPSIVFGLFGMIFFVDVLGFGYSLLSGSLTMVLIVLPTVIRSTEESLLAVPDALREGSLALGASKVRTIFKIVLPSALPGIVTAMILSVGRIVGESAALIYTAGAVGYVPSGFSDAGSTFAVMMWMFSSEGLYMDSAYATAAVLLILVAILNLAVYLAEKFLKRGKQ